MELFWRAFRMWGRAVVGGTRAGGWSGSVDERVVLYYTDAPSGGFGAWTRGIRWGSGEIEIDGEELSCGWFAGIRSLSAAAGSGL